MKLSWCPLCLAFALLFIGLVTPAAPPEGAQRRPRNQLVFGPLGGRGPQPELTVSYEPIIVANLREAWPHARWILWCALIVGALLDSLFDTSLLHDLCTMGDLVPQDWVGDLLPLGWSSQVTEVITLWITIKIYMFIIAILL